MRKAILTILLSISALALAGCANTTEKAIEAAGSIEPQTCRVETPDGTVVQASGASCGALLDKHAENQARRACAEFSGRGEDVCLLAVAMAEDDGESRSVNNSTARDLLITAMRQDGAIKREWISTVPIFGNLLAQSYRTAEREETWRRAFEAAGPDVGEVHVGRAGGSVGSGSGEGDAGPTGEANDNQVVIGNDSNVTKGDGNVTNEGRNPVTAGTGQPESTLDGDTVFENQAPATAAPQVEGANDKDGSGMSIVPGL